MYQHNSGRDFVSQTQGTAATSLAQTRTLFRCHASVDDCANGTMCMTGDRVHGRMCMTDKGANGKMQVTDDCADGTMCALMVSQSPTSLVQCLPDQAQAASLASGSR